MRVGEEPVEVVQIEIVSRRLGEEVVSLRALLAVLIKRAGGKVQLARIELEELDLERDIFTVNINSAENTIDLEVFRASDD